MKRNQIALAIVTAMTLSTATVNAAIIAPGDELATEQELVRGNGAEPNTLDPTFVNSGMPGDIIVNDMFEGLVLEDQRGKLIPGQAQSWQWSEDGKQITFTLRDGIKWSNGTPVKASDFEYAWKRALNPMTGNNTGHYLVSANIANADLILKGDKTVDELGVEAVNDKTLKVTLDKPTPYFLSLMTIKTFFPVPEAVVEKHAEQWTKAENIVTNGAYKLSKWVPNEYVEVVRNPQYWDDSVTVINKVTYLGLASQSAEYTRFQAGEIDMTNRVQLEYYQKIIKEKPQLINSQPLLGTYLYTFNMKEEPFDDVRVRKALSMAIDRRLLVSRVIGQGEKAAYSLIPPIITDYEVPRADYAALTPPERLDRAKALLKKAGYDEGDLSFTLTYNTSENHKKIALALASMWKPLGVEVELENQEWQSYVSSKAEGDFEVARSWTFGDYVEPSAFLTSYTCEHVANESGYCDPKFDALMEQASHEEDQAKRYEIYHEAEKKLNQAVPFIPLFSYAHTRLVRETLKGMPVNNPKGNIYAKDLYFTKQK